MHPHRSMAIFILNKTSRLEPKSQKRVESAFMFTRLLYFGEYHMSYHLAMTGCCLVNKAVKRSTACCPSWSCSWA